MIRAWLLAASLLLLPALVVASPAAGGLPVLSQHVTDLTGTLTAAQVAELEASLVALEKRKGSQLMVLMVPTTGERGLEDYSLAVVEKNKVGRAKVDDGLLLLIAKEDRKARIEVGYGLEGVVTDALSSRVIREYLAPRFRQGDYFGGIREATATLAKLVDGEPLPAPMAPQEESGPPPLMFAVMLGLFVGLFAGGTGMRPVTIRRVGAGVVAAGLAWLIFSASLAAAAAAIVAFLLSGGRTGRFGSGGGGFGTFPTGGWGGGSGGWGGGSGGGGGWSGGGGSFGGGGASGGW